MKNNYYLFILLIISIIGFSAGLYFKYLKSYTDEKFQVRTTKMIERQPNIVEVIDYIEEMETISNFVTPNKNNDTLQRLKAINLASIIIMFISIIGIIGTTRGLLLKRAY